MDSIFLKNLEVWTRIGVPDAERAKPQRLIISIELFSSIKTVSNDDDVSKGIDYATVTNEVLKLADTERKTVERFAEDIATLLLQKFQPEGGVKISICKKPDLPLEAACISIIRP